MTPITYTYNAIGNLTSRTGIGSYTYGNAAHKHAVTVAGTYTYTYDLNGNMTTRIERGSTWTQAFNVDNRVPSMTNGAAAVQFVFDGDGQRVKRIELGLTSTVYVGALYELNIQTGITSTYSFAGGKRIAVRTGGVLSYLYGDHLGSTSLTTNSSGGVTAFVRYKPIGVTRDFTAVLPTDFGYTAQRFEANTGYTYDYGARMTDIGRCISSDTVVPGAGNPQALNRYSYSYNNPALGGAIYGYGSQVINNLDGGNELGQALTTNIDPAFIVFTTGTGAVIGSGIGVVIAGADIATGGGVVCAITAPCRERALDAADAEIPSIFEKGNDVRGKVLENTLGKNTPDSYRAARFAG